MKVNWNKKYTTIAVYVLAVIVISVLFVKYLFFENSLKDTFSWVGGVAAPIICAVAIAYILNPLMVWVENKLFTKYKQRIPKEQNIVVRKLHNSPVGENAVIKTIEKHAAPMEKRIHRRKIIARAVSLILTVLIFLAIVTGLIIAVVPSVSSSIISLADNMGGYITQIEDWAKKAFENRPEVLNMIFEGVTDLEELISKLAKELQPINGNMAGNIWNNVTGFVGNVIVGLKNFILGFIIAIYLMFSKERLMAQMKKMFCAFLKPKTAAAFLGGCSKSNDIFKKYIISNIVDSLIIMVFMMIGMFAMRMPYQMLISVVCAVTNLIPFFGPFLGAVPCGLLILLVDPTKVIWFGIFVLVLQQLDGNVIKPLLFGESLGLPAIWVLVSITIGGALFKIPGMLLGAPVFAVIYTMFADLVKNKLRSKNLPGETDVYEANSEILAEEYLRHAAEPGKVPASFEEATKPEPTEEEKDLPEPISENQRSRRKRK